MRSSAGWWHSCTSRRATTFSHTWTAQDRHETGAVLAALRAIICNSVKTHLHDLAFRVARDEVWPDAEQSSIDELLRDFAS